MAVKIIFLDGESKSGKTAAGSAIASRLHHDGHNVRSLVAGEYFRHVTLLALADKPQSSDSTWLEPAVRKALQSEQLLLPVAEPQRLHGPDVEELVSAVASYGFMQEAASSWRVASAQKAVDDKAEVLLFDGRNLRRKLSDWLAHESANVALDLNIFCRPDVAGARKLHDAGVLSPTPEQLSAATQEVIDRRQRDRQREYAAYVDPDDLVDLKAGTQTVEQVLAEAFAPQVADPPLPIRFDNSDVPASVGLDTVTTLAVRAIERT